MLILKFSITYWQINFQLLANELQISHMMNFVILSENERLWKKSSYHKLHVCLIIILILSCFCSKLHIGGEKSIKVFYGSSSVLTFFLSYSYSYHHISGITITIHPIKKHKDAFDCQKLIHKGTNLCWHIQV